MGIETEEKQNSYYSIKDISLMLGISDAYLYQLIKKGSLKAIRIGEILRVSQKDLDEFLQSCGRK